VSGTRACIVLAGGLGTRLRAAVPGLPKCLAPVGDRSFLERQLRSLADQGFDRFVLSLGYMADAVQDAARSFRVDAAIEFVVESRALGTGGATRFAMRESGLDESAVVNGDTFIEADLTVMLQPLRDGESMRMALVHVADRARYGGVELVGESVARFVEKGHRGPGLINAGLYVVHRSAFDPFDGDAPFSLETDVMPRLVGAGRLYGAPLDGDFIDIGVPEDYERFCTQHGAR
jgi:D-glycero-alpha-D-manno-heptose 1-phosphate guanylyltransferase